MADGGEDDEVPGRVEDILCKRRLKEIMCQPCLSKDKKTVADTFCSTCNEFQCIDCSDVHNVLTIFKNHQLVNANVAHVIRCDQHQKVLDFFCKDENKLCCRTCAIVDHRACKSVAEVEKITGEMTSSSSDLDEILQEAKDNAEDIAKDIITAKDQLVQEVQEIQAKIREMRDKVMRMFVELEVAIVKRAKTFQKETLDNLEKKQFQIEKYLHKVTAYLETVHSIFKTGTPTQQFIAEQKMDNEVSFVCRNVNEECQNFQTMTISFDFDEQLTLPPKSITDFVPGQLTLKYHERENVNAVNKVMTLTQVSSIELKKTGDNFEQPFYSGIDFLSDGRLVAVDSSNLDLIIYNEKLEKVGSYQLSYPPMSIVAVSEDEVAITSGSECIIDFLHVSKANKISPSKKRKVTTNYNSVCLKDNRQLMVGTFDCQKPVEIIPLAGESYDFCINFPNKAYPLGTSTCTYIRNSDKVVLTDRYEDTVYIYDIKTNTRVVVKDDQIQEPRGVAVDPSDTILVCSHGTNSIVQISQTGHILSSYKIDMIHPYRACVSRDKLFLVVINSCIGHIEMQKFKISL